MPDLTQASAAEYDNILHGNMTPSIAAQYLREGRIVLRSFGDVLQEVYPAPDAYRRLIEFFHADGEDNLQSTQRKIRNWIADRHPPSNREDVFKIAFALGLNEAKLSYLLEVFGDYGIQYRNGRELVQSWFLRAGKSYREAVEFYDSLPKAEDLEFAESDELSQLTTEIHYDLTKVGDLEELRACYMKNLGKFGHMHLRAYFYFERFINLLIRPSAHWEERQEENYSVERVMDVYLSMRMPTGKKRDNYSVVQKLIKKNWPNATSIKNIRNHKEDVSRKLLLLLYVATENVGIGDEDIYCFDEESMGLEERIDDHWWTLNAMLNDCGMAPLDPRNAFDWLILYAMSADEDTTMSERLEQVIGYMFEDKSDENNK